MRTWVMQEIEHRFEELLDACLSDGPQLVQRNGVETAVLVPVEEWRRLETVRRRSFNELLLAEEPKGDLPIPDRHSYSMRPAPDFD